MDGHAALLTAFWWTKVPARIRAEMPYVGKYSAVIEPAHLSTVLPLKQRTLGTDKAFGQPDTASPAIPGVH